MALSIEDLTKRFGAVRAVDGLDLTIEDGRFVCLLGPSGCGKTTTLRMLAGLEFPDSGRIRSDDRVLSDGYTGAFVPPEERGVGLVFQSYALWPHLTVSQNIGFGLEMRHWPRERQVARVQELMDLLRIGGLGGRYPSQLSGGQQQRVALARSLAPGALLLLLDEPLSNLDAQLRLEMRAELKRLHEQLGNTIVFVTHDQLEAMTMATDVAVMHDGKLQQYGPPLEIYRRPANVFVATFIGSPTMNVFTLNEDVSAELAKSVLRIIGGRRIAQAAAARTIGIRPEALSIGHDDIGGDIRWTHRMNVEAILPTGAEWIVRLRAGGAVLFALCRRDPEFSSAEEVTVAAEPNAFHLFDGSGVRIANAEATEPPSALTAECA